jgi:hypothetical protein
MWGPGEQDGQEDPAAVRAVIRSSYGPVPISATAREPVVSEPTVLERTLTTLTVRLRPLGFVTGSWFVSGH